MDPRQRSQFQKRIGVIQGAAWVMILVLVVAYAWVQIIMREKMQDLAQRQAMKTRVTPAPRGIIYDRNGNKLVDNRRALHLVIQREDLPLDVRQIEAVAEALQLDPEQLRRKIDASRSAKGNRLLVLQDNLDDVDLAKAEMLRARYPFLSIEVAPRRVYLGNDLAGHALGFVGEVSPEVLAKEPGKYEIGEIIGRSGFEASRNDRLKGQDGQRQILVDHLGREVALFGRLDPRPGRNVYLTLDAGMQQTLREAYGKEQGAGVVIDLRDGGILAMYSSPSMDPNIFLDRLTQEDVDKYYRNPSRPMLNRAIQGLYPPGSTFKLLVALAALDKGLITPATTFTCHGQKLFYNRVFRCDNVHGTLNLVQAIAQSCDIYFYELGARMDIDEIHAAAVKYGLAEPTGVDLPHEVTSRVPSREWKKRARPRDPKWYAGETISVAIGQGANSLTPISLARFYGMLATKGKLLTPHLYYGTRDEETGKLEVQPPPPPRETGLDPKAWAVLDEGLYQVVQNGTARGIRIPGLDIAGKTGTSQVTAFVSKSHYSQLSKHLRDNALFAGYAPRENPQIAFAFVVENAGFGASSAAPIAKKMCAYWFLQRPVKPLPAPGTKPVDAFLPAAGNLEGARP
ncbi:MAG TPA: penicillin-binding protein 2 [Holophaga sp.]|nr:penicillin-binding protein 2 [Holophaga sp.]HPS68282.1 penicillin-binding protein 2 [Holophaga sp.]